LAKKARVWDGTAWQELASAQTDLTAYSTTAQTTAGFRNAIINGGFDIWQRGTATVSANGSYPADRWLLQVDGSGATRAVGQQTFTPGNAIAGYEPAYFLRYNQSVAGSGATFNILDQRIEDVRTYAGQVVTVSFWAKASATTTIDSSIQQVFGSGGSSEISGLSSGNITLTTSWVRYSYTGTLASISGKTIGTNSFAAFRINFPRNATFVVDIWGVQIEKGSIATPFEQRPIGTELALCQRYYYKSPYIVSPYILFNSGNVMSGTYQFPVTMRVAPPSITYYDGANTVSRISIANAGGTAQNNITPPGTLNILNSGWNFGAGGMGGTTGNNGNIMLGSYEASAEL
jgi:hypothetical protein